MYGVTLVLVLDQDSLAVRKVVEMISCKHFTSKVEDKMTS